MRDASQRRFLAEINVVPLVDVVLVLLGGVYGHGSDAAPGA